MNNKGFGLQELLLFIGCSMFVLIAISIYCKKNFDRLDTKEETNISQPFITPSSLLDVPEEYSNLETRIKKAALYYNFNKTNDRVITLKQLKRDGLIGNLIDPFDNNVFCSGYVLYKSDDKKFIPFIKCPGMYETIDYNSDFNK